MAEANPMAAEGTAGAIADALPDIAADAAGAMAAANPDVAGELLLVWLEQIQKLLEMLLEQ